MMQSEIHTLTTQTRPKWHPRPKMPVILKYLNAKKLYSCECGGYSRKLSLSSVKQHAKKVHNALIDESSNNCIIEVFYGVETYIYSLKPRPQALHSNRRSKQVQRPSNKMIKLRRSIESYRNYLKAYDKRQDLDVIAQFHAYIKTISSKITDDPEVSDDVINYFNEFIMNAPFLKVKSQEISQQSNQNDLIMRYTKSLRLFWVYLKDRNKTSLELQLRQEFVALFQHEEQ